MKTLDENELDYFMHKHFFESLSDETQSNSS